MTQVHHLDTTQKCAGKFQVVSASIARRRSGDHNISHSRRRLLFLLSVVVVVHRLRLNQLLTSQDIMSHSSSSKSCHQLSYATLMLLLLLAATSWTSNAFIAVAPAATTKMMMQQPLSSLFRTSVAKIKSPLLFATPDDDTSETTNQSTTSKTKLTHGDITWRLRPPETSSKLTRLQTKLGANALRFYSKLKGETLPPVLCPKGGRAMLEAYYKEPGLFQRRKMIGRFGFTTSRGPSNTESELSM